MFNPCILAGRKQPLPFLPMPQYYVQYIRCTIIYVIIHPGRGGGVDNKFSHWLCASPTLETKGVDPLQPRGFITG